MGKRHRKGKGRYASTNGIDDILDEQMIEPVPEESNYGKKSKRGNKKAINSRAKLPGKIDRNQRRKRPNIGSMQQRNIIQKGKLVVNAIDEDTINDGNVTGAGLKTIIETKKKFSGKSVLWHKVTLIEAAKVPRKLVFDTLLRYCAVPFSPICLTTQGKNDLTFYVENAVEAKAIKDCNKMTIHINADQAMGEESSTKEYKLNIRVITSRPPETLLNSKVLETIKKVMARRYRSDTKALDLKSFHTDQAFVGESVYAPLARSSVVSQIIQIIGKEIPDVEAIDFSSNRIPTLNHFSTLAECATNINLLYLSDNRLSTVSELKSLKAMKNLKELKVDGNLSMEKRCGSQQELVKAVQKILPNLQSLNGNNNLPKVLLFEGDEDTPNIILPQTQQKMLGSSIDTTIDNLVGQFLEQYFKIFDSENRLPLEAAYHEETMFSLSVSHDPGSTSKTSAKLLSKFHGDIRNLLLVKNMTKRFRLLRKGRLSVIDYLANYFPNTKHNLSSFTLDIPFVVPPELLSKGSGFIGPITITGMFQQCNAALTGTKETEERLFGHFNHTFLLVPRGQGFVIVNEMLVVSPLTSQQIQELSSNSNSNNSSHEKKGGEENLNALIISLGNMTNMNAEWCKRCLEETGWNLEPAFNSFTSANAAGKIPPNAFN